MKQEVSGSCPACGEEVDWLYTTENIPYFADILIITCSCPVCGYRFSDVQNISTNEPVRYRFTVSGEEDLSVRVVRSGTATITIPEFGVEIAPGPACEGFVSNVEGILCRIEHVLESVIIDGDDTQRRNAISLKEKMADLREGHGIITIIIGDPEGNSLIDSERAIKEEYQETD
ncbi:MAG: ZPR1 zinc finger domain-containing protein [Methanospirillum sp.]|nr:ZPR1 zinc finger domain-containing protein [Methanospirillum sp.]